MPTKQTFLIAFLCLMIIIPSTMSSQTTAMINLSATVFTNRIELSQGWNLISILKEPANNSVESFFADANISPTVWTWLGHQFSVALELHLQRGYWVFSIDDNDSIPLEAADCSTKSVVIKLQQGWNLISVPGFPLINSIESIFRGKNISPSVWTWAEGQFLKVTILEPFHAYWVFSNESDVLVPIALNPVRM